jgi:hypothetical protein
MSALGQERTSSGQAPMSGLPLKADIGWRRSPLCAISGSHRSLFDKLVRAGKVLDPSPQLRCVSSD